MLKETPLGGLHEIHHDRERQMHDRGHTYYAATCDAGAACAAADAWAARRLITPRAFREAARTEHRIDVIAAALCVTPAAVRNYLAALTVDEWLIMQRLIGHPLI